MRVVLLLWFAVIAGLLAQTEEVPFQKQVFVARNRVLPALVHVEPIIKIYTRGEEQHAVVTGSGVIFSPDGYVVTNHHVAANAAKVWCTLSSKERITASVVGSDPSTDIAVLKLNTEELADKNIPHARLGNSDSLEVGQIVLALGSPLGLSRSVSMGVISSIDRYFPSQGTMISPYNLWIQTDAAINPGNSGGPLINLRGEVIGINARAVFFAENLGFAIPINLAREVAEEILKGTAVKRSWIGIDIQQIKDLKEYLNLPDFTGVLIVQVEENSPAAKAGLRPGDVLRKIGDTQVNALYEESLPTIRKIISGLPLDQKTAFRIWRDNKERTVEIQAVEEPLIDEPELEAPKWGMVIKNLSWHIYRMQMLSDFNGVYITSVKPGSAGEYADLRAGDVVRKINGETVKGRQDFQRLYEQFQESNTSPVFLELIRGGHSYFAVIKPRAEL
ncbi:MAG: trypsin-like peptidase domain-containing protein [Calditrichaceae bacterium]|nr:trypsin-like peptidase domain-containing protein [Calditrichia bacterium]NUQ42298.1 trypsin-like peptidase domain-containing protein [Calditrichaceae bacterium]